MRLGLQRRLDRIVGKGLCRILSALSPKGRSTRARPERILVILLSEMGSLVLAKPMFDHIQNRYPGVPVYVLVFDRNREVLDLLDVVPPSHVLTVSNRSLGRFLLDSLGALVRLRRRKIDTVVDCELFSRISSIYSFLSGAKTRAGFHPHTQEGLYRGNFINRPVLYNPYSHISLQFINLVEALGADGLPTVKRRVDPAGLQVTRIRITQSEIDASLRRFRSDFPHVKGRGLVFLYPGGGLLPIRAWPLEYFCRLAEDLVEGGYVVGVIGLEEDAKRAEIIQSRCGTGRCVDLTGYTGTVRELMIMFHYGSLLITNDGGPGHFASLTPIPAILFYGPETPILYGPLGSDAFAFHVPLSCSPCLTAYNHRNSPCDGNNVCLKCITPERVISKSHEILENQRSHPFAHAFKDH